MMNRHVSRSLLAAISLSAASLVACVAEEVPLGDEVIAEEEISESSESLTAYYLSPDIASHLRKCGEFYALAGWSYMANDLSLLRWCDSRSPSGHCLMFETNVYDLRTVPDYLRPAVFAAKRECEELSLHAAFGSCPNPGTLSGSTLALNFYDRGFVARAIAAPYTASYWEGVEGFFADSDACYRAAGN